MMRSTLSIVLVVLMIVLMSCEEQVVAPEMPSELDGTTDAVQVETVRGGPAGRVLNFTAPLSGSEEVPPVETNATGLAKFKLSKDGATLNYKLNVANIEDVVAAHIHCAPDGANGPVGVTLFGGGPVTVNGTLADGVIAEPDENNGCGWDTLNDVIEALKGGETYVNVHTLANPPGEIRGQIDHGNGVARSITAPQQLAQQLNAVRDATKKYRDIEAARADGYAPASPYVPGMGFHFADGPPFGTDLEDPGVLVYYTNGSYNPDPGEPHDPERDDDLILGAVEYLVPGDQVDDPPNIFADEDSPRNLKVTEEEGWHFESAEGFTGVHAWIHRGNPDGVFHPTNRNID